MILFSEHVSTVRITLAFIRVYVCFISWIEACIDEQIPASVELEEGLRNGVVLAKLAHFITPDKVPLRKVYDKDLSRYNVRNSLPCHCTK